MRSLSVLAVSALLGVAAPLWAADRPNIIIMMTDDQRFDAMSCAGNTVLKTPNMDRLAKEGVRARNMFVTNSLCSPSRATLLTGLYSHTHGVLDNNNRNIDPKKPIVSDRLREAGYEVAFCGKSHQANALRDFKWDYYFGYKGQGRYVNPIVAEGTDGKDIVYEGYMDDVVTGKAIDFLKRKRDKPFCLFLFFKAPHRSWVRAPRYADLFKDVMIPKPPDWDADRSTRSKAFAKAENQIGGFDDVKSLDSFLKDYYATLVAVDENVGKVRAALEATGQLDNTFIMFTSDNGFFAGEYKCFDKRFMHEPSIRVPLLVRYPKRIKADTLCDAMILNVDIAPTMLDVAGLEVPKEMHGRSALKVLAGEKTEWRKDWLYEYYEFPGPHSVRKHRGVRTERYKLIHYYEDPEEFELYDLQEDPREHKNLYGKEGTVELTAQLRKRLEELRKETGDR
jgi:arylsulfatase A-like enzyme